MCGILFIAEGIAVNAIDGIHRTSDDLPSCISDFGDGLTRRGPDGTGQHTIILHNDHARSPPPTLTFSASLLQLRGSHPSTIPPLIDTSSGNILLWNGEIFGGDITIPTGHNDSLSLLHALTDAGIHAFPSIMSHIRGPWAVVFWEAATKTLWFGRDVFGRRSLLMHSTQDQFLLTSVSPLQAKHHDIECVHSVYREVPPGLYRICMGESRLSLQKQCIGLLKEKNETAMCAPASMDGSATNRGTIYEIESIPWDDHYIQQIARFERSNELIDPGKSLPSEEECFDAPEMKAAVHAVLDALQQAVAVRCRCIEGPWIESKNTTGSNGSSADDTNTTGTHHHHAVLEPSRVLILFSGGVDSTLIAALAHQAIPEHETIDLASICFNNGQSPDRETSLDALKELESVFPKRKWRLLGINKTLHDIQENKERLLRLLSPSDTMMDLNIGAALWLATEADGIILNGAHAGEIYKSKARAVLLGHGADELFAGYSRCRTRFRVAGWCALSAELALDVGRLWVRNLGRDDRLVADRSREGRHPFLDERVVMESLKHPLWTLADMRFPRGEGEKRVLRECLRMLGLPRAAGRMKRAIQFGTRLARETNIAQFGGTRQANTKKAGRRKLSNLDELEPLQHSKDL